MISVNEDLDMTDSQTEILAMPMLVV